VDQSARKGRPPFGASCASASRAFCGAPGVSSGAFSGAFCASIGRVWLFSLALLSFVLLSGHAAAQSDPGPSKDQPKAESKEGQSGKAGDDKAGDGKSGDSKAGDGKAEQDSTGKAGAGKAGAGKGDKPPEPPLMGDAPPPAPKKTPVPNEVPNEATRAGGASAAGGAAGATRGTGEAAGSKKADDAAEIAAERPTGAAELAGPSSEVYAEDWWKLSRPVFEFHGYYRVRSEFLYNFHLGRRDAVKPLWPRPPAHSYIDTDGDNHEVKLCGDDPNPDNLELCDTNTQAGANMRFRLNPELHISDNVRIRAQIDLLDNIVLGSTPEGYANQPGADGGYAVVARGGYSPMGSFVATQWAPQSGYNGTKDSILVKRVWGEYSSPIGQLRFGRMPSHWGLGMFVNSGDGHDADWGSTADRLMFITGVKSWDLYFGAAWDFANEGAISAALNEQGGQPYDLSQKDDVDQWVFIIVRRMNEQLARKALRDGDAVVNGGAYVVYRNQSLANDTTDPGNSSAIGQDSANVAQGFVRRGAEVVIPDWWIQFRYEHFRMEIEAVLLWGSLENTERFDGDDYVNQRVSGDDGWNIRQFGIATQTSYDAIENRLHLQFGFGLATGDSDVDNIAPLGSELQPQLTLDRTFSTFRFHPDYQVDLILWRRIMTRVQGAYYFKPEVAYDFLRDPDGQKIGGGAAVIWSRASEFAQAPGHAHDLGVEINLKLYFQAKDGVLNDDANKMGGFFTSVEYGVLFPLDGLGYLPETVTEYATYSSEELDTETAHTVRWYLGIMF
jgi:uncharacterized protein (TIGR04551 family)